MQVVWAGLGIPRTCMESQLRTSITQCATNQISSFLHRWIPLIELYNCEEVKMYGTRWEIEKKDVRKLYRFDVRANLTPGFLFGNRIFPLVEVSDLNNYGFLLVHNSSRPISRAPSNLCDFFWELIFALEVCYLHLSSLINSVNPD